jgi:hypothetical protein
MPNVCQGRDCLLQYRPSRKGCGGRQTVQSEYLQYAKVLMKDGAEVGDWICLTHRNELRLHAATYGIDLVCHVQPCAVRM